jgi:hypothetical protein
MTYIKGNFRSETRKKDEQVLLANDELMREIQLKGSFVLIKGEQPLVIEGKQNG